ncbi:transglycosylase family protein [Streptomyces caeni]|uniref:Transglycosylase family protein n=1 Tax=Streptomyces caeni TaxID=2307231 RepID=A0ABW4INU3_9ACTN
MTGSAIAIPLLGATGASAASGTTWDRVAECESGGSWSADTGNGRFGGLQMSQDDWDAHGGLDYAPRPDQASRSQQIAVAEKILADRGVSVWPGCGLLSGLDKDPAAARVDTGVAGDASGGGSASGSGADSGLSESPISGGSSVSSSPSPSSSPSAASTADSGKSKANASESGDRVDSGDSAAGAANGDDSDKSDRNGASSGAGESGDSGAGRHRGGSTEGSAPDGRTGDVAGRHASRDSSVPLSADGGSYTVRPGDSLSGIADSLDLTGGWTALYDANKQTVGTDPDLILPGQSLALDVDGAAGSPELP